LHERQGRAREIEEGRGTNRCQSSPPGMFFGLEGKPRRKGKNKVRLGKTKQKYKLRNQKEEKISRD